MRRSVLLSSLCATFAAGSLLAQTPVITGMINAGTLLPGPIAPDAQVNIAGSNLGDPAVTTCPAPVPTVCAGVSVLVNGKAAAVRSVSAPSVAFYVPIDLTGTGATVQVTRVTGGQTLQSAPFSATVASTAPGLFTTNVNGVTLANFQDSTGAVYTPGTPAKPGDFVKALGTGFGVTNPPLAPGTLVPASPVYDVAASVKVIVGGQNAIVSSATLVPNGLGATDQVIFQVPAGLPGGNQAVVVNVGGQNSQTLQLPVAFSGPRVTSVVNSASNAVTGLPNAGVAPGSIIVAYGTTLGPDTLTLAPGYPWPATLSGTSAQITVNGKSVNLLLYYTSANQIAGLLPSGTPPGNGTITVTYNGQAGGPSPITVLQNNFGVYTVPQNGTGPGIVTFADYSLVSTSKAANPGETLIIWGTGLGAVTGDEAAGALPGDMANLPVQVFVGGVSATVVYRGRSGCCVGEDQIAFVVPDNLTGCLVPLAVRINNQVSNYSTMAIAPSGRACVPSLNKYPVSASGASQPRILVASFNRTLTPPTQTPLDTPNSDAAEINAFKIGASLAEVNAASDGPPFGSCVVVPGSPSGSTPPLLSALDAGPALSLKGPAGTTRTIAKSGTQYLATLGDTTSGNFLDPGAYSFTGPGGTDIASFTAPFTILPFSWTNRPAGNSLAAVNRSQGYTLTWTGGDPNGYVQIQGGSGTNTLFNTFVCQARTTDGTFTVPSSVLLAIPSAGGNVQLTSFSTPAVFTATGLDFGAVANRVTIRSNVNYQ